MTKNTKAAAILEMINKGMSNKEIRTRMHVSPSYLWKLRKEMPHKVEENDDNVVRPRLVGKHKVMRVTKEQAEAFKEVAYQATRGRQARLADATDVDKILDARGSNYGDFMSHAEVTQQLKNVMMAHLIKKGKTLVVDQQESLEMIFHKIGRIVNGDPDYADSWVDIAGYAKLVADRLQGTVR